MRGDSSGSAFTLRGLEDGKLSDEVMVGAKLRCCKKSSKYALDAVDDWDEEDDDGREELVTGDWGEEKGEELVDVDVEAEAAEEGREWASDSGRCLSSIEMVRVSVIIAERRREGSTEGGRRLEEATHTIICRAVCARQRRTRALCVDKQTMRRDRMTRVGEGVGALV